MIPRPVLPPLFDGGAGPAQRQRQRGKGSSKGTTHRSDEEKERLSRSSFNNASDANATGKWGNSVREEDQTESSVCLDPSGVSAMFCRTVQFIHRSVSHFVTKTSILQSVNNSSSNVVPTMEPYSVELLHRTATRTASGELDGGNTEF